MAARDGHVHVLPLHVANKIAAGEVVERPASVVKELVENSVDAGAANIKVSIAQGGRKLVSVRDDGCGMTKEDALLSLERQATSKILDVDDIENIDTLGFRGEAIPSIASVSRFSIVTRRHDADEGTQIVVNAGELVETSTAGCPPGTLVEVRDLFCNVPARRKFLRSFATEEGRVKGIFTVHALAHPGIGFSLVVDGRELYRLAPEYAGNPAEPGSLRSFSLHVIRSARVFDVTIENMAEPDAFRDVRGRLEAFAKSELGIWAIQSSVAELVAMSADARRVADAKWAERESRFGNYAEALRKYDEALQYLETVDPKPADYEDIRTRRAAVAQELEQVYVHHRGNADHAIGTQNWEQARYELHVLFELVPDTTDERHQEASRKLLEVEAGMRKKR